METIKKADETQACEIDPSNNIIFSVSVRSSFPRRLSRRRRRDAPDGNGSQKPLRCPSPGRGTKRIIQCDSHIVTLFPCHLKTAGALLYLHDEHDDCEVSLMDRTETFHNQIY